MASTAIRNEEDKKEFFDSPEELEQKVNILANWIRESQHFVGFTGAGISTSAGIPDFRSGYNTVLPTGPGAWEVASQQKRTKPVKRVPFTQAIPTLTHMSFHQLIKTGKMKHLISQNVDGLHRKSGVRATDISELHGNIYIEKCRSCNKQYLRDYEVGRNGDPHTHRTNNQCDDPQCKGDLFDIVINFSENLDSDILTNAYNHSRRADLHLAMGSSLRVTPAADMPLETKRRGGKLVIVNLQRTPLDDAADLVIHAFCDTVMERVMQILQEPIPGFRLVRHFKVQYTRSDRHNYTFTGIDYNGEPFSVIRKLRVQLSDNKRAKFDEGDEPFNLSLNTNQGNCKVRMYFYGHYNEPEVSLTIALDNIEDSKIYTMVYNPFEGFWESIRSNQEPGF